MRAERLPEARGTPVNEINQALADLARIEERIAELTAQHATQEEAA